VVRNRPTRNTILISFSQRHKGFLKDCPSGQLDRAQFRRIYKEFFPFGDPVDFADRVFNLFDENKNATIDFKEFICALSVTSCGRLDEKLKCVFPSNHSLGPAYDTLDLGAFQLYDINEDGTITYDEMLQVVRSIYNMIGEMVKLPPDEDTPEKVPLPSTIVTSNVILIYFPSSVWIRFFETWTRTRMGNLH